MSLFEDAAECYWNNDINITRNDIFNKFLEAFQVENDFQSCAYIGKMLETGDGVSKDKQKAIEMYKAGAEGADFYCNWSLGRIFREEGECKLAEEHFAQFVHSVNYVEHKCSTPMKFAELVPVEAIWIYTECAFMLGMKCMTDFLVKKDLSKKREFIPAVIEEFIANNKNEILKRISELEIIHPDLSTNFKYARQYFSVENREIAFTKDECKALVEANWKKFLGFAETGDQDLGKACIENFDKNIELQLTQMSEEAGKKFVQDIEAEREIIFNEYSANPQKLKQRLGVVTKTPHQSFQARSQTKQNGLIVNTVIRATIWESIRSLFNVFR